LDTDTSKVEADGVDVGNIFYFIYKKQRLVFYLSNILTAKGSWK